MSEFSSASSSATSPSPRPYRGEYQRSQSPAPPTRNNTMLKPPMHESSSAPRSTPNPSSSFYQFYGGEYSTPQSSWDCHTCAPDCYQRQMQTNDRRWQSQPQNRTLGPIRYAQPPQQHYANVDMNVIAVHLMHRNHVHVHIRVMLLRWLRIPDRAQCAILRLRLPPTIVCLHLPLIAVRCAGMAVPA